ncbi:MAG TPA: hypothetical protein VG323_04915 [Thermoanaerobaculia bacterium]|nr:hypothetical protein [Thermoanaerobaculia bacterium]
MARKHHHFGGVSPKPRPDTEAAPVGGAQAHPGFGYHGGQIIRSPRIVISFWGDWSDASHQSRAQRLTQFMQDLLASKYMNILSQYGVGKGAGAAGAVVKSAFISGVTDPLSENDIHATIQSAIGGGMLAEPGPDDVLIIYLAEGIGVSDAGLGVTLCEKTNDNAFGYHHFLTTKAGNRYAYSIIPALDDGCLRNSCSSDAGCSLHLAETQEQRQTQVTSHEFSEMTTNPFGDGWFDDNGGDENGDICNGLASTITVHGRHWNVQRMYSKHDDDASGGVKTCVVTPSHPLPELSPGP